MPLPPEAVCRAGLRIVGPAAAEENQLGQLVDDAGGISLRLSAAAPPGVYQVQRDGKTVFGLALELPPEESDLRAIEPELLPAVWPAAGRFNFTKGRKARIAATMFGVGWPSAAWPAYWANWLRCVCSRPDDTD